MKEERRARLALISSMVVFGTIGVFRRQIPLPSSFLAMTRGAVGALFLLLVLLVMRRRPDGKAIRANLALLIVSGAAIGFNWILLFEAYNYTSVATATLCYYFAPIFAILLSPVILRERETKAKPLCVVAALVGMVLVSGVWESGGGTGSARGVLLGLGAAALYASVILMNKRLGPINAYDKTVVQLLSAAVVLLPYVLLTGGAADLSFTPLTLVLLAVVCIVHTGVAYALYFSSFAHLPAQTLALFSYIDPVVAVLLSALLLREPMTPLMALGAVLILGAAICSELPGRKK